MAADQLSGHAACCALRRRQFQEEIQRLQAMLEGGGGGGGEGGAGLTIDVKQLEQMKAETEKVEEEKRQMAEMLDKERREREAIDAQLAALKVRAFFMFRTRIITCCYDDRVETGPYLFRTRITARLSPCSRHELPQCTRRSALRCASSVLKYSGRAADGGAVACARTALQAKLLSGHESTARLLDGPMSPTGRPGPITVPAHALEPEPSPSQLSKERQAAVEEEREKEEERLYFDEEFSSLQQVGWPNVSRSPPPKPVS